MKKKTTVQSVNEHSTPPAEETKIQKHEVPGLMTLSDSILSGAVVEYRKAGYSFARHLHTNIEIYRILSGECYMDIQSETIHCTAGEFIMLLPDVVHSFYLTHLTVNFSIFTLTLRCFPRLLLKMREFFLSP